MYGWKMQPRALCIIICMLSDVLLNPDVWTWDMDHLKRAYLFAGSGTSLGGIAWS